jgi:hypothetical protein
LFGSEEVHVNGKTSAPESQFNRPVATTIIAQPVAGVVLH